MREISSELRSIERERSPRWGAATIEIAEHGFELLSSSRRLSLRFESRDSEPTVGPNIRNLNLRTARLERFALLVSQGIARAPRAEFPPRAPHTAGLAQVAFVFDKWPTGAPLSLLPAGLTKANQPPFTGD